MEIRGADLIEIFCKKHADVIDPLISKELYESYKRENDDLLEQICQYDDNKDIPDYITHQYKKVARALIDYERAYHPLPGRVSTIMNRNSTVNFESFEFA